MFYRGIDPIVGSISNEFGPDYTTFYSEDGAILFDPEATREEHILDFAEAAYRQVGLKLNREKCKCTLREDVTFMGVVFSRDKAVDVKLST